MHLHLHRHRHARLHRPARLRSRLHYPCPLLPLQVASAAWVDKVLSWDFERVIPAHFDAPVKATPTTLRPAFGFLQAGVNEVRFCDEDVQFLREALEGLPPDLALFDTPLGPLRGKPCGLADVA